ncbi:Tyrosinase [Cercospora beticola]|uniref:tyrosinase n=1 Tax=Cercospora beticola TaxID=122368 RepID=A0A2G5HZV8_CERBT|nr:Tyrosinase [Cercospora beticola]PIA98060.1 Tyrosinase [Cercospora beticola]WPA98684.1 hypothetical protein RHO25_003297 [Cercospora beticola]CAK1359952.1 unnamed protein product [Cercospora beticola]
MKFSAAFTLAQLGFASAYLPIARRDVSQSGNASPPARKDITTMSFDEFSLFVLAMQQWQSSSTSTVGGFYQVAGIHGAPHTYWDGSAYQNTNQGNKNGGYCFHGTKDFYLWHRPYLALFEQQMQATAVNISNNWASSGRTKFQGIANTLKFPYWDWARNGGTIPSRISSSSVLITNAAGQNVTVANPLFSHTLVSGANLGTNVCPGTSGSRTCRSSNAQRDMQNSGASLQRQTALLLNTANVCWNVFATYDSNERRASGCSSSSVNSLEGIHNTIHNNICGTMCNLDTAAYDPIFWLHHANVDRIGALWNYLNPNVKVTSTRSSSGNFVFSSGVNRDASFTYMPFRASQGNTDWWLPSQLYDVRTSGYTYPEIADRPSVATLQSRVNNLYGNGRTQQSASTSGKRHRIRASLEERQASARLIDPPSPAAIAPFRSTLISANGSYSEYTAEIDIRRSVAPGTSFNLHLFFGDIATGLSNSDYLAAANRVGGLSISQAASTNGANSATGIVPLTDALLNTLIAGGIRDFRPGTVRKFVRARMVWRLVTSDGQNIGGSGARSNGLQIRVRRSVVTPDNGAPRAVPVVEAPEAITEEPVDNTQAQALPAGVAATSAPAAPAEPASTGSA